MKIKAGDLLITSGRVIVNQKETIRRKTLLIALEWKQGEFIELLCLANNKVCSVSSVFLEKVKKIPKQKQS